MGSKVKFIQSYFAVLSFMANKEVESNAANLRIRLLTTEAGKLFKKFRALSISNKEDLTVDEIAILLEVENPEVTLTNLMNPVDTRVQLTPAELVEQSIKRAEARVEKLQAMRASLLTSDVNTESVDLSENSETPEPTESAEATV